MPLPGACIRPMVTLQTKVSSGLFAAMTTGLRTVLGVVEGLRRGRCRRVGRWARCVVSKGRVGGHVRRVAGGWPSCTVANLILTPHQGASGPCPVCCTSSPPPGSTLSAVPFKTTPPTVSRPARFYVRLLLVVCADLGADQETLTAA